MPMLFAGPHRGQGRRLPVGLAAPPAAAAEVGAGADPGLERGVVIATGATRAAVVLLAGTLINIVTATEETGDQDLVHDHAKCALVLVWGAISIALE